eukprot:scaffold2551_cov113-Cylindrotheca_fusiformis.AAC.10
MIPQNSEGNKRGSSLGPRRPTASPPFDYDPDRSPPSETLGQHSTNCVQVFMTLFSYVPCPEKGAELRSPKILVHVNVRIGWASAQLRGGRKSGMERYQEDVQCLHRLWDIVACNKNYLSGNRFPIDQDGG